MRHLALAGIAVLLAVCPSACSEGAGTPDGFQLGADAFGADALSFCSGQTKLALDNRRVSMSSIRVEVTSYHDAMLPGFELTTLHITGDLPLASKEQGVLEVHYNGSRTLYNGKTTLAIEAYNAYANAYAYPLITLYKCPSAACTTKTLLEELKTSEVKRATGWVISDPAKRRVSFCLHVDPEYVAAHPELGTVGLYLNAVEATFKTLQGG